jgi:hypothetical protein
MPLERIAVSMTVCQPLLQVKSRESLRRLLSDPATAPIAASACLTPGRVETQAENPRVQRRSSVVGIDLPLSTDRSEAVVPRSPATQRPAATPAVTESFALLTSSHAIGSLALADNRSGRNYLGEGIPAREIARLAGEGRRIRREGLHCLDCRSEAEEGRLLCDEMIACDTLESLLGACASFSTRSTFLYRRVNKFWAGSDAETGGNLGLYIGLLRECFCVCGRLSLLSWESPNRVYRGADLAFDLSADYARRPGELIRWQSFTSSSRDLSVALGFQGSVLFEISFVNPVASLNEISPFRNDQEFILSPFQLLALSAVRWDSDCQRWILSVEERVRLPDVQSWFVGAGASPRESG